MCCVSFVFFFQAEDGIRDLVRSRGLGDVYKRQVMRGDMHVYVPSTVFFEVVYVLTQRAKVRVVDAADALIALLGLPGLDTDHPAALVEAMRLWRGQGPLSFADCFHLVLAKQLGMTRIYTFDQKMDRYPGVSRIEPS